MGAGSVNIAVGCGNCKHADAYGRGCEYNLLMPVYVLMGGKDCPNREPKTAEQVKEQYELMNKDYDTRRH